MSSRPNRGRGRGGRGGGGNPRPVGRGGKPPRSTERGQKPHSRSTTPKLNVGGGKSCPKELYLSEAYRKFRASGHELNAICVELGTSVNFLLDGYTALAASTVQFERNDKAVRAIEKFSIARSAWYTFRDAYTASTSAPEKSIDEAEETGDSTASDPMDSEASASAAANVQGDAGGDNPPSKESPDDAANAVVSGIPEKGDARLRAVARLAGRKRQKLDDGQADDDSADEA